jgi:hypothetical protein
MHTTAILKVFACSQGAVYGALVGAVLSVASLPATKDFFPVAMLALAGTGSLIGLLAGAYFWYRPLRSRSDPA